MSITSRLAQLCCRISYEDIPAPVKHQAERCLLDCLGVAIAGKDHQATTIVRQYVERMQGAKQAAIIGCDSLAPAEQAAMVNGTMAHVHDFDDTHLPTVIHPSCTVVPAALAVGQWKMVSGKQLLEAIVTGMESALRIGLAVFPEHYDRGWHITGTVGVFGAAVAAGKLLGLDATRLTAALGTAATQSSGLRELFGTMGNPYLAGHAAANGVRAACLAEAGFTSSPRPLQAPRGWAQVVSCRSELDRVIDGWGKRFEMLDVGVKPYPSGVVTHPAIDAVYRLRQEHGLSAQDVESATLTANPLVAELTGKENPSTGLEAKFSVYHCVAAAFLFDNLAVDEFTDRVAGDPRVAALRDKVVVVTDTRWQPDQARLEVVSTDGGSYSTVVEHAVGSPGNPMTDAQLQDKFIMLTEPVLGGDGSRKLIELCWGLSAADPAELLAATVPC